MNKFEHKTKELLNNIIDLVADFKYRQGPDLYFYKKTLELRKKGSINELFKNEYYLELIYATLTAWDMNSRGAKMKYYDEFKNNILNNKNEFIKLEDKKLSELTEQEFKDVSVALGKIFTNMNLMKTHSKLVSNAKVMHFILPDLVMPMDRKNTLNFFFGNTGASKHKFLKIFNASFEITQRVDLNRCLNNKWCTTIPKVIDNAIIAYNQKHT